MYRDGVHGEAKTALKTHERAHAVLEGVFGDFPNC